MFITTVLSKKKKLVDCACLFACAAIECICCRVEKILEAFNFKQERKFFCMLHIMKHFATLREYDYEIFIFRKAETFK